MEKCYGVSKAGQNDCAAGAHSCAGSATASYTSAAGRATRPETVKALVPATAAKALSDLLPDVEVGLVEDSSHAFLLEYPQELAAGIKSFLHESGDD